MWDELQPIGRDPGTGGYRRYAWTPVDATLREWFTGAAEARGLEVVLDRAGNQWAWWGNPDETPGVVLGSHLDSVPDGGAFDGPLGVVSAFAALDGLPARPSTPIGIVNFADEEGARFGVACTGSRLLTGALRPEAALALRDGDGTALGEVIGVGPEHVGRDEQTLRRIGAFVELHVEQGRALVDTGDAVGIGASIWPHGRWRVELPGEANHAGTTALADRRDPMLALAALVQQVRASAQRHDALATCGKVAVSPNAVNAVPSSVTAWVDARGADEARVRAVLAEIEAAVVAAGGRLVEESWTGSTPFTPSLSRELQAILGPVPVLPTGAGHDAGVLATAGVPSAMLFVRNPTGVSHSPAEHAEESDCLAGVAALTAVLAGLL
ncbi:MAG: putative amidohydrolase [Jatrophihabitans sp.]|nr:putative amidohydrolase [Jatrophihabitans sp.]